MSKVLSKLRKALKCAAPFFAAGCVLCFTACAERIKPYDGGSVRVVITGDGFTSEKRIYDINKGSDLSFDIVTDEARFFISCDYAGDYDYSGQTDKVTITLEQVKYDARVFVKTGLMAGTVKYYLNGGKFADGTGDSFIKYSDSLRQRVNTDIGRNINRDGYTLLGWNTSPDGSGRYTGLGSKITLPDDGVAELYAQWAEWTPSERFTFEEDGYDEGCIRLTGYVGDDKTLCVPERIDDKTVTSISRGFSHNCPAKTLILPRTLRTIEVNAFRGSRFEKIYFFDNISEIYDKCFGACIPEVHINAAVPPRYTSGCDNAQFAVDMDRLILNADNKKLVFFAGCSMSYGLDSAAVEKAFGGEYVVCNMGVIGGTNAKFQFECMLPYLGDGDVFVHAPEEMSAYQFMRDTDAEARMFMCTESNYDLLSACDFSDCNGFFNCFTAYNKARAGLESLTYEDVNHNYNEYGDMAFFRPNGSGNADFELGVCYDLSLINADSACRLNALYTAITAKGCRAFFSFAPVNRNALSVEDVVSKVWEKFSFAVFENIKAAVIVSSVENYLMEGQYFYDADYHLTTEGAKLRTEMLVSDLKAAGV